jgi:2-octaprenyl-6-methoxyphenol hydroxylase
MLQTFDMLIIGTGPVGYVSAIGLARAGRKVALIGPADTVKRDGRTVAILDGSVQLLGRLGCWDAIHPYSAPLSHMRMIDDTGSLFRAPPVTFKSSELKLDAFGYNVELADLVACLSHIASNVPLITRFDSHVAELNTASDGHLTARLASGQTLFAPVIIGADGRKSVVRTFAGIEAKEWSYPQTALTAIFKHQRDHHDISTEFHTRQGPFTLVPLPGKRSSIVWMMDPQKAERLAHMSDKALTQDVEKQAQFILGSMAIEGDRGLVPMAGLTVNRYASDCIALVGEAAHVFPPIGAQGLNLGFRDVSSLLEAFSTHRGADALAKYNAARQADVKLRTAAVDVMNKSLLADYLPIDLARSIGLLTIASIPPLRRFMMQRGAGY